MRITRTTTAVRLITLSLSLAAFAGAADVHFGPTSLASTETARLNAYCDGSVVPGPCQVKFEFFAVDGSVLLAETISLAPGTAGFVDLPAAKAGIGRGRGTIDPCWDIAFGGALASLEIFDSATMQTHVLINWGDRSMPRSGDVDFAPAAITRGDTAGLGAYCPAADGGGGDACRVVFEFHDAAGRTVKQSSAFIMPGASASLNLDWGESGDVSRRVTVRPCIKVGDGGPAVATLTIVHVSQELPAVQTYPATLVGQQR